ncbi:Pentapeptide_repeats-containing protein [Hexamita inflata]|uniref:Pentapeptide repeats-containing protein n=1 Tax=Hexamita inflata TaxID=28002 RepID=A0AA86NY45_9EUKA|nr:Pentapeptide repeats-containing protein [Hexamita inflata]CAI9927285.1 Pentapeptide repeats-containing protein [Hexamita inflata]
MKNNALTYAHACGNPIQIFGKLLDLLTCSDVQGMNSNFKKDIAHVAQLFSHQVYIRNKDGVLIVSETRQGWKDQIKTIRNLISSSQLGATELEFELDCIEAGLSILSMGHLDIKNAVLDYATQIGNGLAQDQLKQLGKDLLCKLSEFGTNKMNKTWYLTVMTNYYTQFLLKEAPDQIEYFTQQLLKPQTEWKMLYAGLDVVEFYLETTPKQKGIGIGIQNRQEQAVQVLKELSTYQLGINAWKIRDKVANICIRNGAAKNPHDQLPGIYTLLLFIRYYQILT